ncbi:MAG: hypothetical protein RLZZ352_2690 [Pseudomonadota bacterium]|jgi:hypothetical protein
MLKIPLLFTPLLNMQSFKPSPIQEISVEFLQDLYHKEKLPLTTAMISIANGYYPSTKDILSTLQTYSNIASVKAFVEKHEELLDKIKESEKKIKEPANSWSLDFEGVPGKDFTDAYENIKKIPIKHLEEKISEVIKSLVDGDYKINISSLKKEHQTNVEIILTIAGNNNHDGWPF